MARSSKVAKKVEGPEKKFFVFVALKDGTTLRSKDQEVDLVSSYSGPISEAMATSFKAQFRDTYVKTLEVTSLDGWTFYVSKENIAYAHIKDITEQPTDPASS